MPLRDVLQALLVVLVWGCNFVAIRLGLSGVPPLLFAAIRFTLIAACALVVKRPQVRWRDLAAVGLLMSAGQFGFLYSAIASGVPSGLASLVLQAQAPLTVIFAAVALRERPRWVQVLGLVVACVGLGIVALGRSAATGLGGIGLVLCAATCWAAGNIAARRCKGASGLGLTVWGSVFVPLPLFLLSLAIEGPARVAAGLGAFGLQAVLSTAYTVVLASLLAYTIWNTLLGRHPAADVAPFTMLVPVAGFLAGWLVLGERPTPLSLVGGVVLLVGIAAVVLGPRLLARPGGTAATAPQASAPTSSD